MSADNRVEIHQLGNTFEVRHFNCSSEDEPGYKPFIYTYGSLEKANESIEDTIIEYGVSYYLDPRYQIEVMIPEEEEVIYVTEVIRGNPPCDYLVDLIAKGLLYHNDWSNVSSYSFKVNKLQ